MDLLDDDGQQTDGRRPTKFSALGRIDAAAEQVKRLQQQQQQQINGDATIGQISWMVKIAISQMYNWLNQRHDKFPVSQLCETSNSWRNKFEICQTSICQIYKSTLRLVWRKNGDFQSAFWSYILLSTLGKQACECVNISW